MSKLETREQAEARALELYPSSYDDYLMEAFNRHQRQSFLQCWEEMQQECKNTSDHRATSLKAIDEFIDSDEGKKYIYDMKQHQKEMLCEMMRKDEEDGVYELNKDDIEELLNESEKEINSLQKYKQRCETGCKKFYGGEILHHKDCFFYPESITKQHDQLREAAEKVVYEWHNSVGEECIDAAMVKLVKVLNSKKH